MHSIQMNHIFIKSYSEIKKQLNTYLFMFLPEHKDCELLLSESQTHRVHFHINLLFLNSHHLLLLHNGLQLQEGKLQMHIVWRETNLKTHLKRQN